MECEVSRFTGGRDVSVVGITVLYVQGISTVLARCFLSGVEQKWETSGHIQAPVTGPLRASLASYFAYAPNEMLSRRDKTLPYSVFLELFMLYEKTP